MTVKSAGMYVYVCVTLDRAGMVIQPRYAGAQHQQQSSAVAAGYQYYTPVYSQYTSVAVPPPPATWLQPTAAATPAVTPGGIANHFVMPQQLQQIQPAVRSQFFS